MLSLTTIILVTIVAVATPAPLDFAELLKNPAVWALLGISSGGGGIAGWVIKGLVGAAKTEAGTELEIAVEALERAKKTPDPGDDIEAQKHYDLVRRIKNLVDAFPDPK